jgi:hypothetical protein
LDFSVAVELGVFLEKVAGRPVAQNYHRGTNVP